MPLRVRSLIVVVASLAIALGLAVGAQTKWGIQAVHPLERPVEEMRRNGTEPMTSKTVSPKATVFLVHAGETYYKDNPAPELTYQGILEENGREIVNYPLYRDLYLLENNGEVLQVEYRDTPDMILASLLDRRVEIQGKYVTLDQMAGGRQELWVGYISALDHPSQ